jgi:hypothetical protein
MVDYVKLAATALKLIEKNGRAVTLVKLSEVPANASEPWKGPASASVSVGEPGALGAGKVGIEVIACFVSFSDTDLAELFGPANGVRRGQKTVFVAGDSVAPEELRSFDRLIDGADVWSIESVDTLRPGDVSLLHYLVLTR